MPDVTKSIENEREAQAARLRYEPPVILDLGELARGQGDPGAGDLGTMSIPNCLNGISNFN